MSSVHIYNFSYRERYITFLLPNNSHCKVYAETCGTRNEQCTMKVVLFNTKLRPLGVA